MATFNLRNSKVHCRAAVLATAVAIAVAAVPAQAEIPTYPNPGVENPASVSLFTAGNNGRLRTWFMGNGGAGYTVLLGAIVNGIDRGTGINNQTFSLGQLHDFGAINLGDTIKFYINVVTTGQTYTNDPADNADGVNHLYFSLASLDQAYGMGLPFTPARRGSYFAFEDLDGGGDFNYTDLQFAVRIGAIPEPATWAFMILGFGLIGGALRRQSRVTVRYAG
jgi:hypothetical protein